METSKCEVSSAARNNIQESKRQEKARKDEYLCCPNHISINLKIRNISSENQLLKKKIKQLKEQILRLQPFQNAFYQSIKVTKSMIRDACNSTNGNQFDQNQNNPSTNKESPQDNGLKQAIKKKGESLLNNLNTTQRMYSSNVDVDIKLINKCSNESPRLKDFKHLSQLSSGSYQERQTVKSLEFSIQSASEIFEKESTSKQNQQNKRQQKQILKIQFQRIKQRVQLIYQLKICKMNEQLNHLKKQNQTLQQKIEKQEAKCNIQRHLSEHQFKQTAHLKFNKFWNNQHQNNHQIQQPLNREEDKNNNNLNKIESGSAISELHLLVSGQLTNIQNSLIHMKQILHNFRKQIISIVQLFVNLRSWSNNLKIMNIQEYIKLIECKQRQVISKQKCTILEQQIVQLKFLLKLQQS